jgi:hypothetical protein
MGEWYEQWTHFPHKSRNGWDISGPVARGTGVLVPYLVKIFRASLTNGHVPAIWG